MSKKYKLEFTWIGREHRPRLEPRILLEEADKSYDAAHRITDRDLFDNRLVHEDNRLALRGLVQDCAAPEQIKAVEAQCNDRRRSLFEVQDAIDQQRGDLIGKIEGKPEHGTGLNALFTVRWAFN